MATTVKLLKERKKRQTHTHTKEKMGYANKTKAYFLNPPIKLKIHATSVWDVFCF